MVLAHLLRPARRTRNPARRAVFVLEILAAESGFEHSLLIADDQLVLDREEKYRNGQEPKHARDGDESHPDQKISDVQGIPDPGKNSVGDEPLHRARATAGDRASRSDASEANNFTDHD